jgi:hypothetical protein
MYCVYVEYDDAATAKGFRPAAKSAQAYATLLRQSLSRFTASTVGEVEDPSRNAGHRRKRDLETTFLYFPVTIDDGRRRDLGMAERFRTAVLRADQEWEQAEARMQSQRHQTRQGKFRQRLERLLSSTDYQHLGDATKARLTEEVTRPAFPDKGIALP